MEGISFIIFSSNNSRTIGRSIKSVIQTIPSTFKHFSITVFDQSSIDGSAGIIKKTGEKYKPLSVVFDSPDGLTIQQVFNDNLAEYIIVLDANTVLEEGGIVNLISTLEKSEDILMAGAKVKMYNHTLTRAGRVYGTFCENEEGPEPFRQTYYHLPDSLPMAQIICEPDIISTLCYAMRSKDFHDLYPDGSDLRKLNLRELCFRIKQKGGRVCYQPKASVLKLIDFIPKGFMFNIDSPESTEIIALPDIEQEADRIRKDIETALAQKRIEEFFSSKKSGFNGYFSLENAHGNVLKDLIKIKSSDQVTIIGFPALKYYDKSTLIVVAEIESHEKTSLLLKYKTKADPSFSDKKSYNSRIFPGRQIILFSFVSDHLSGNFHFELEQVCQEITFRSIEIYCYIDPRRLKSMVSVVIPCYNHGEFLDEAVGSLEGVDKEKYEVIIVDDGSDDPATTEKLRELETKGYFVLHQENKGLGAARNEGIRMAKGNYILPLDSDNKLRPIYISRGIEILDMHPDTGVIYGDVQQFGNSDNMVNVPEFDPKALLIQNFIDACALFRKEVWEQVGGYEENMVGYQDWAFWMAIAATENWSFYHIDDIVFDYRIRQGSMVSNTKRYHYALSDYMLAKNISFFRREFQKLYFQNKNNNHTVPIRRGGHETLLGSIRIHLQHFFTTRIRRKTSN
jgi:glycosyltransferase involved in cell wall biosynthesis